MPSGLLRVDDPVRPERPIALRIAGLVHCEGAEGDMALFLRVLLWCVSKEGAFLPASPTASEELRLTSAEARVDWANDGLEVDDVMLAKAYAFFGVEWMHAAMGGSPTDWTITVPREIRRFRRVRNVYDYLRIIDEEQSPRPAAHPLTVVVHPPQRVQLIRPGERRDGETSLGVDSLHPLVRDACAELFSNGHYREGVLNAVLALRDLIRTKSGLLELDGSALIGKALNPRDACIVVSDDPGDTGQNMQRGTVYLAQGIFARLRNPLVHEKVELKPAEAMEMVALISRVVRDVAAAAPGGATQA